MKKIILFFILCFSAQGVFAESISRYEVEMQLQNDASVFVTETIEYNFDGEKHGIFRFIPVFFEVAGQDKKRFLDITLLSVKRDEQIEPYTQKDRDSEDNFYIKIGNPDATIKGKHTYEIQYLVTGSLRYFETFDEIYWNAIGDKWPVPISNIEIKLRSKDIPLRNESCYVGESGSTQFCDSIQKDNEKISFSQSQLAPYQGMTVAASFEKGLVPVIEKTEKDLLFKKLGVFGGALGILLAGLFVVRRKILNYVNKYKTYDPIHARYEPPQNFDVLLTGYLSDKKLQDRDISAGIIELAQKGYLSIERIEGGAFFADDYIFSKKKKNTEIEEEKDLPSKYLLDILFEEKREESIRMSDIPQQHALLAKTALGANLEKIAAAQDFIQINHRVKKMSLLWIPVFFIACFVSIILFKNPIFFFVFFVGVFAISFIFQKIAIRYTEKGWQAKHAIEGFKKFLDVTEKDRLDFHNAPEKDPETFMKYLPYAIALGIEEKWAKQFEGIFIPEPEWFSGIGTVSAMNMADSFSGFSRSFSSATSPKSSGSGSGGGGSSGGGSGGGGGGSW